MTGREQAFDRRRVLQAGLAAAALTAVPTALRASARTASPTAITGLPTLADWEAVLGDVVVLVGDGFRTAAQVVDVRDTTPTVDPAASGSAYSVLFDLPDVPPEGYRAVEVHTPAFRHPARIVMTPVNGDGSWETVVDTRLPNTR